ncbi:hypothetical protein Ahy_A05g023722 [Arachis hypogaea]|uniref:Uncharacterized protein n=1 Tax=Arachis hypogaea TaxID=3818 RepID=A0A445D4V4_ARAHY|nr:hypothetical protein Ahy_A05g023722 [Arachis hypogaea]
MKSHSYPRRNEVPSANAAASQAAKRPSSFGGPTHDKKVGLAKIVPALAAGNSIVLKPPTQVINHILYSHILYSHGSLLSLGWFSQRPNQLCYRQRLGDRFTCGDTGIAISKKAMELGGKDACNVFEDADLDLGSLKLKDITVAMMN